MKTTATLLGSGSKAGELLAQQLSQLQAQRVRAAMRAPTLSNPARPGAKAKAEVEVEVEVEVDGASLHVLHCTVHD